MYINHLELFLFLKSISLLNFLAWNIFISKNSIVLHFLGSKYEKYIFSVNITLKGTLVNVTRENNSFVFFVTRLAIFNYRKHWSWEVPCHCHLPLQVLIKTVMLKNQGTKKDVYNQNKDLIKFPAVKMHLRIWLGKPVGMDYSYQ